MEERTAIENAKKPQPPMIMYLPEILKPTPLETIYYVVTMVMYVSLTLFGVLLSGWAMWGWFK